MVPSPGLTTRARSRREASGSASASSLAFASVLGRRRFLSRAARIFGPRAPARQTGLRPARGGAGHGRAGPGDGRAGGRAGPGDGRAGPGDGRAGGRRRDAVLLSWSRSLERPPNQPACPQSSGQSASQARGPGRVTGTEHKGSGFNPDRPHSCYRPSRGAWEGARPACSEGRAAGRGRGRGGFRVPHTAPDVRRARAAERPCAPGGLRGSHLL